MKLLHTADLHLGKRLNEISLLEDQAGMLEELRRLARQTGADALVIAGDIYDKSVPPAEAVELFSDFVSSLAADGVMLYAIAGNHDSGERLAFAHRLLARQGVHFAGQYDGQIMAVCQRDEYGPVNFYLLPFLKPGRVKRWFGQVESYEDAVRAVLEAARVDFSGRNVLVAHQFVTAGGMQPERSESETEPVAVGGAYSLDVSALEGFDYVALGHIHRAQAMGRPAVRYAGSPLKYSFSEARHDKSVMLVELKEKGCVEMTALPLAPKRDMLVVEGPLEALLAAGEPNGDLVSLLLSQSEWLSELERFPVCMMEALPTSRYPLSPRTLLTINAKQLSAYGGSMDAAAGDLEHYRSVGFGALLLCGNAPRARNLQRMLQERDLPAALDFEGEALPAPGEIRLTVGALSAGTEYPQLNLAILTEGQLTAASSGKAPAKRSVKKDNRQKLLSYTDLTPGDLVVHAHHGIGRFEGMRKMPVDGVEKDYIKIAYAGGDSLYVPATQLDLVSKYIGGGGQDESRPMKLNKLGGTDWTKQKAKAKAAAKDLAKGLIALYAERQRRPGFAFSPDSPWQREFEEAFDYAETDDQLRCIAEIKADMEKPRPMDRLLCGDVGYGKTEVALRAVMKCILDGKQAAILVPTTVLAQQHYATAVSRFRNFPVKIEVLSRFTPAKEQKRILEAAAGGHVDLLIGTHKLLQKNMVFKDLGLLVIDEEQRFGVTHKERLKEMSRQVDVLTLSATPIPRTLNMALSGLRDMSTLEEPPRDRQPVQTYVLEHDWAILEDAMRRELSRGGQIYYLHNRVESIDLTASRIQKMLGPEVRIVVGHGKMSEHELSSVMQAMVDGEADILVCTTIIETGIDISNVNTLIIEDADKMGLAQLHQIRGRIGRSSRRAYAYLTYRRGKVLQETAAKRLAAIREYVEFGSGFKIAMRDLEIRGAGNLLGPEQSGYLMSVGYDMYLKLLEEAVLEEKGEEKKVETECSADLTINANIPERYVPAPEQRMDLYRRIAAIRTNDDASDLLDEMLDRYGEAPRSVLALLDVALLRAAAAKAGVCDITQKGSTLRFTLAVFRPEALVAVCGLSKYKFRLTLSAGETPMLTLKLKPGEDTLEAALALVEDLKLASEPAGQA